MAYGIRRFNAAFTRAPNNPYPEPNQPNSYEVLCEVSEQICFYSVRLLALRRTPKLEDHCWSAVQDCLFNISAVNLHI